MTRKNVSLLSLLILLVSYLTFPTYVSAYGEYQTGWWVSRDPQRPSDLATYAAQGNTLILLTGGFCSSSQLPNTIAYLDEAQKQGMKAIVGLNCQDNTPYPFTSSQFVSIINSLKYHPALYAYYIGDEPEWSSDAAIIQRHHSLLATDPGYYNLVKSTDPAHPALISLNMFYNQTQWNNGKLFFDVLDILGIHGYPTMAGNNLWQEDGTRSQYDIWKTGIRESAAAGKKEFIATCMGFGSTGIYRAPTYEEARYQVFTAVVQGVKKVLFWMDDWGKSTGYTGQVNRMIGQIQAIGKEMNNGVSDDPRIAVSVTDRDQLTYRYGSSGTSHVILAVNIANRTSAQGQTLSNVRFTLPAGVNTNTITVLDENRSLPVSNGSFTDSFSPFQVHVYSFVGSTTTPITIPGDSTGDGHVTIIDYNNCIGDFGSTNSRTDFNKNGVVDISDYNVVISNFGK